MEEFCGSPFWDVEKIWNTSDPYFTSCFEQTILVWFPCSILWLFAPLDIYWSFTSQAKNIPWSALNVTKIMFTLLLILLELILLQPILFPKGLYYYTPVELYTPIIKSATYLLALILLLLTKVKGIRSSGVLFVFWFLTVLCEGIKFRTVISSVAGNGPTGTPGLTPYILEIIYFPCVVAQLLLNCWADIGPTYKKDARVVDRPCPEESSSYLNRILYEWYGGLAYKGYKKPLEYSDLWELNEEDKSKTLVPVFEKHWAQELAKASRAADKRAGVTNAVYTQINGPTDLKKSPNKIKKSEKEYASIVPALIKSFGSTFFFGSALKLIPDLMVFVSPQILNLLIGFISQKEEDWKGYLYAVLLFVSAFIQTILMAQYSHRMYMTGMRVRTALVSAVYRKALVASNSAKRESTVGEIVNLMSVDVQKIMDLIPFVNMLWSAPLQIGVAMYFLWDILGPSVLSGLAVIILLIPANAYVASKSRDYQIVQMKNKDQRVKLMNEILSGIKVLKLYAWEPSFENQIMGIRNKEVRVLTLAAYLGAGTNFLWTCAPFLVALATFGTYVLIDEKNVLDPQKAFVSLSLLNVINLSVAFLPMIIVFLVQAIVSVKRLNKFMNAEEIDPSAVSHDKHEVDPIVIENGNFSWEDDHITLRDIDIRVKAGSLLAVVGTVGSGKSSLLSAMLGELDKTTGRVNTKGSISYVAQQAWIQNATLRDNITFGFKFDPVKYDRVVEACALKPDLEILPAGDKTEIGEKGINLSGGQKQRVSLARATYNNSDVFLFDDPLSAVDSHVGKHIFEKVLGPRGLLRKKTRVLVTHGISFLPQMDQIIVMKDGEISETGTYQELLDKKGAFAEFLSQHITSEDLSELEMEDGAIIKGLQGAGIPLDKARTRRRRGSESERSENEGPSDYSYRRQLSHSGKEARDRMRRVSETPSKDTPQDKLIEVEKSETESVKMSVYLDYFRAAGWTISAWTFILYLIFQGFSVGANLWLSEWSNEPVINGTQDASKTGMYLGVYGGLGLMQAAAILAATIVMAFGTIKSAAVLHMRMLARIFKAPMSFFDTTPVGRIVNRFAKDIDICDNTLPFMLRLWLNSFLQVASTLVIISYSTPIFIAVVIPIGAIYYFVQRFYVSTSRQLKRLESVTRSPIYSHFSESITGSSTIRAYGQQERFILESESKVDYNQKSYFPAVTANRWLAVRLETVGNTVIFFAALFAVLQKDTLNAGIVGLSVSYALQITIALNMLVRWTSDVETNIVAVERIKEYTETPQEADWEIPSKKPPPSWPEKGEVTFDHYKTRYRDGLELVLRNVTCKIEAGEKIGIVGRTGAGKSSLTLGLFRIIEAAGGSITIDGQNIAKLGLHDVRGRITIIPQDPVLFSGTLRINLDPFNRQSDEEIWRALELSHLKSYVKGLHSGLQHEIAEGGDNLSVGQRQLVCLARALLRKTKILVLDEATAAVDLETDDLIQETIRAEFKDSTVITIAHRLNTIMDSTRVIVLDKGEISEFDSPSNLLSNKLSIFYGMAKDAGLC